MHTLSPEYPTSSEGRWQVPWPAQPWAFQATSGSYGRDQTSAANAEDTQAGAQMMLTVYPLRSV